MCERAPHEMPRLEDGQAFHVVLGLMRPLLSAGSHSRFSYPCKRGRRRLHVDTLVTVHSVRTNGDESEEDAGALTIYSFS